MKRILSVVLAVCLVFALSVSALAVDTSPKTITSVESGNTATIDVGVTVTSGGTAADSIVNNYYVVVAWTVSNPTYTTATTAGTVYTWDGAQQKYTTAADNNGSDGSGNNGTASVTVTNKSDMKIKAKAEYTAASSNGTSWSCTDAEQTINEVTGTGTLAAAKSTQDYSSVTPSSYNFTGAINLNSYAPTASETIGTITVTISAAAA